MKHLRKVLAVLLTICMLAGLLQSASASLIPFITSSGTASSLNVSVISDTHFYPESMFTDSEEWLSFCTLDSKEYAQSEQILEAGLKSIEDRAESEGTEYLLIPGDLTKDSEYDAHVRLAEILKSFEERTGIQVIVTNGNHDINNSKSCTFADGTKKSARSITAAEFAEVYADLGFDLADAKYVPTDGTTQGMLSYAVNLNEGYRLIVVDSCIYDAVNVGKDETGGRISEDLMSWIKQQAALATSNAQEPVVMMHHNVAPHMKMEPSVTFAFCVDDYLNVAETFADLGINYAFTGHLHTADTANVVSDNGNVIYDLETPSLTGFPNQYRDVVFTTDNSGVTSVQSDMVDIDEANDITIDGVTYSYGQFKNKSFALCFGGGLSKSGYADCASLLMGIVRSYGTGFVNGINEAGGILPYLSTSFNLDLKAIIGGFLEPYIGTGISLGGYNIFSVDNIMWFIEDLLGQIEDLYIKDPEALWSILEPIVDRICSLQVSEVPCTKFIDTLGFGDANKGGTLGDCILSAVYYWDSGNEDIYNDNDPDLFMQDTVKQFRESDTVERLFNLLVDAVFNDILDDALLSKLEIRIDKLLGDSIVAKNLGKGVNYLLSYVLRNDFTYQNLVDTVFGLGALPYTSIFDVVDKLLIQEYLTDSQFESIGYLAAYFLEDFSCDSNPYKYGDYGVTYTSDDIDPEITTANYRSPTMVSVTMGEDTQTSANINWFSKSTLSSGDIEIYESTDGKVYKESDFTGTPTTASSFSIDTKSELVDRFYPGIDIGIAGLFNYNFKLYQHTVTLTNLKPGTTYYYRVGNAARGWWSKIGSVETANGDDKVTFLHMSDPQSQNENQYTKAWSNVVDKAFGLYPDAKFIAATGDLVDYGMNTNQWQWMFDTASDNLMNTYLMPVTGNHEEKSDYSTVSNFALSNIPEQDTKTGVYYSYEYNNVLVIVLNTNDLNGDDALNDAQIEWLKKTANDSDAEWKVVALHKALYSNGSHYDDDDVCAFREQLGAMLPELDIDLVLQGHDHVYLRTYSLNANEATYVEYNYLLHGNDVYRAQITPTGTTYVISGTSGVKTYQTKGVALTDEYFPRAQKIYNATTPVFSAIEIEDGILYFTAYAVDGDTTTVIDKFAIQKDTTQGEKAEDYVEEVDDSTETSDPFFTKFITVIKTILNVFWNIFRIYILGQ